ncbi:MAG: DinB family protein [Pyrinomonadaceae bacterium]|nr:DinB family protein [Pyrinomonadaceae bacterium]
MTEVERIGDQSQRAFAGDAWHGPSLMAILEGVTASQAAARPFDDAHSIWELVFHIAAWEQAGVRRLAGDHANLSDDEDWPAVMDTSEPAWEQTKETLRAGHKKFQDGISKLDESRLGEPVVEGLATVYVTLHGIIQHTLYHAGQIAILKKATGEGRET